ncbi:hypothetical protein D9758_003377 [Tetrapyrgos nigripes]|uniref:HMG box domain-containing protein n=1 Tax=Tetrapyrgos nigripes TaxID=182062 RepID=A0A8H5LW05_9AGAR|nr:hypothetical protein D9758_003377 [Tetrapyrgos nigripes]
MVSTSTTHLQARRRSSFARRSSLGKVSRNKYNTVPTPARLTFYPNITPNTYESQEEEDLELELTGSEFTPLFPAVLVPTPNSSSAAPKRKRQPPGKKKKGDDYIPRPPNAFMLFRANFVKQRHVPGTVESNHGSLSKIIGSCWRSLPSREKAQWDALAKQKKREHQQMYPNYKFCPIHTKKKKLKQAEEEANADAVEEPVDEDFDDEDGEYVESSSSLKRKAPSPSTIKGKSKPFASNTHAFTLDNAPPSTYPPTSRRFAFTTLREERQDFIIQCLVQGIKKKPADFVPSQGQGSEPQWLEDHVQRWDSEKRYAAVRQEAEREEKETREAFALKKQTPEVPTQPTPEQRSLIGHRRSSSVPIPGAFLHQGYVNDYGFPAQQQNSYAAGYYAQPHVPGFGWDYPQFQGNDDQLVGSIAYAAEGYTAYTPPYTESNWGTNYSALPSSSSSSDESIRLPQLPSPITSSFPTSISASDSNAPSPAPSPLTPSDTGMGMALDTIMSARPSLSQYFNYAGHRNSASGRNLLQYGRRASSAQPCLISQYNSGAFQEVGGFDPSVWVQQPPAHIEQGIIPQQEVEEREFNPSALGLGWNPNFSFSASSKPATPPLLCPSPLDTNTSMQRSHTHVESPVTPQQEMEEREFNPSALQGWNPNFSFSTSNSTSSKPPTPPILGPSPFETNASVMGYQPHLNLDTSCAIRVPVHPLESIDPFGPSPITAVSPASDISPIAVANNRYMESEVQMYAPQPITPSRVQDFEEGVEGTSMDAMDMGVGSSSVAVEPALPHIAAPGFTAEYAPDKFLHPSTDVPATDAPRVDNAKVFTELWKNLASSQSFCMGTLGLPMQRDSVALGGAAEVAALQQQHQVVHDDDEEEEDGEFEKALRREHSELLAVGGC